MRKWLYATLLLTAIALPSAAFAQATPTPEGTPALETTQEAEEEVGNVSPISLAATPIEIGDTVTGELTEDAPVAYYIFTAEADTAITIIHQSEDFDSYLVLLDADENVLATNDDGAGSLDSKITFTIPADGDYIIQVDSYGNYHRGSVSIGEYELSLAAIELDVIEFGEAVDGELTETMTEQIYAFTGSAGDSISVTMISDDFDTYLYLYDQDGFEIASNDDAAGNLDARIGPFTLPTDGQYRITATSFSRAATGSYTLSLDLISLQEIAFGETVMSELGSNNQTFFTFAADIGDIINITVDSESDTNLSLNDPYGYSVISDEDGGAGNNPEITDYVISSEGTYTIIVGSSSNEAASFELTLQRAEVPSFNDGPLTLNFTSSGNNRTAMYTAEAGQTLTLTLTANGEFSPNIDILQGDTTLSYGSATYVTGMSITFEVPEDGDVRFNFSDYSYSSISVTASVEAAE